MQKQVNVVQISPDLYLSVAAYLVFWEKLKMMAKSEHGWDLLEKYRNAEYVSSRVEIDKAEQSGLSMLMWEEYSNYPVAEIVRLCLRASYDKEYDYYLNLTNPDEAIEMGDEDYGEAELFQGIVSITIETHNSDDDSK